MQFLPNIYLHILPMTEGRERLTAEGVRKWITDGQRGKVKGAQTNHICSQEVKNKLHNRGPKKGAGLYQ